MNAERLALALLVVDVEAAFLLVVVLPELLEPPQAAIAKLATSIASITNAPRGACFVDLMFQSVLSVTGSVLDQPPPNSDLIAEDVLLVELVLEEELVPVEPVEVAPESVTEVACTVPLEAALPETTT